MCLISEHITSIVASMIKNCQATQRQRLVNKFTENDHEKVGLFYSEINSIHFHLFFFSSIKYMNALYSDEMKLAHL